MFIAGVVLFLLVCFFCIYLGFGGKGAFLIIGGVFLYFLVYTPSKREKDFNYEQTFNCQQSFYEDDKIIKPFACNKKVRDLEKQLISTAVNNSNRFFVFSLQEPEIIFDALEKGKLLEFPLYKGKTFIFDGECEIKRNESVNVFMDELQKFKRHKTKEELAKYNEIIEREHIQDSVRCKNTKGDHFSLKYIKELDMITGDYYEKNGEKLAFYGKNKTIFSDVYFKEANYWGFGFSVVLFVVILLMCPELILTYIIILTLFYISSTSNEDEETPVTNIKEVQEVLTKEEFEKRERESAIPE